MLLSQYLIEKLVYYVTGDCDKSVYKRVVDLEALFNQVGCIIEHSELSRKEYARKCLIELNDTEGIDKIIENITDPRPFKEASLNIDELIIELNDLFIYEGYLLKKNGKGYKVRKLNEVAVDISNSVKQGLSNEFIEEQIYKCDEKIGVNDFDGAITNARSLVESVLLELEKEITGETKKNDGDLLKSYKRVQKLLNLEAGNSEYNDSLKQILSGLSSIINGIASLRNTMSDSHARTYKPSKHHAILAVNSAKTIVNFLFDTYQYQKGKRSANNKKL